MEPTGSTENGGEQPQRLVVGDMLPPSGIARQYLKVEREHKVFHNELPPILQNLDAAEWRNASFLKNAFRLPRTGRQKQDQKTGRKFPYCLLTFGPAATCARERLIVVNWWLNLTKQEQDETWKRLATLFVTPSASSALIVTYDKANPQAIGVGDSLELRKKRAAETRSNAILNGGKRRKKANDPPQTNPQLRDESVKEPEARMQQYFQVTAERSNVTQENEENVTARFDPVLSTTSTAFTPVKRGKPRTDVRSTPKVNHFARDRESLVRHFVPIVQAMKANPNVLSLDSLSAEDIVQSLELADRHAVNYMETKEEWSGPLFLERRYQNRSNIVPILPSAQGNGANINDDTSQGNTSQATVSTLSDWMGEDY